jgi:hypothetical protein
MCGQADGCWGKECIGEGRHTREREKSQRGSVSQYGTGSRTRNIEVVTSQSRHCTADRGLLACGALHTNHPNFTSTPSRHPHVHDLGLITMARYRFPSRTNLFMPDSNIYCSCTRPKILPKARSLWQAGLRLDREPLLRYVHSLLVFKTL